MHVLIFILFSIILFLQVIIQPNPSLIGFWQMAIKESFWGHPLYIVSAHYSDFLTIFYTLSKKEQGSTALISVINLTAENELTHNTSE